MFLGGYFSRYVAPCESVGAGFTTIFLVAPRCD